MSEPWQPIETAPKDGKAIQAEIPGHGRDNIIAFHGGAWVFVEDQEPPDDWTDGVCWEVNDDGKPSTKPTRWKAAPPTGGE